MGLALQGTLKVNLLFDYGSEEVNIPAVSLKIELCLFRQ